MQNCLSGVCVSSKLPKLASFKLAFTLTQQHKPLLFGEPIIDWAQSCDPDSKVFKEIPRSRQTLTHRVTDLAAFIQEKTDHIYILTSAAWGIQMDESTDKSGHAQAILYARFIDEDKGCVDTKFLTILRIVRSPIAQNIHSTVNEYVEAEGLPKDKLVSFTTDGASVMRSERGGVAGHLLQNYNPSLLIQHCIMHRQALAARDGLQKLLRVYTKLWMM